MSTPIFTIDSKESVRGLIEQQIFQKPTSMLLRAYEHGPKTVFGTAENRVFCVEAMWADALDLPGWLNQIALMELEWRETPWRTELRPSIIN